MRTLAYFTAHPLPRQHRGVRAVPQNRVVEGIRRRATWIVASAAVLCGAVAGWYSYTHRYILAYQDAQSHLAIARRVFDNRTPGFVQFGTNWLPVPHMLLLPFVQNDYLWSTGLAGCIAGTICLVLTCVMTFLMLRLLTGRDVPGYVGVAVLLSNPSFLYVHTVALTEPAVIAAMTGGTYFLLRWVQDESTTVLVTAGLCAALAVGCRYDGWFFAAGGAVVVGLVVALRTRNPLRMEGYVLAYGMIPCYTVLLYLIYNWTYFGDPLAFQRGDASAQAAQFSFEGKGLLLTKADFALSVKTYFWAVVNTAGWVVLLLGAFGFVAFALRERLRPSTLPAYTLLAGWPFNVLALYTAQSIIFVPQELPGGVFNERYGLVVLPSLAVGVALLYHTFAARSRNRFVLPLCGFLLFVQAVLWIPGFPVRSLDIVQEGVLRQNNAAEDRAVARYLSQNYDGGGILTDETTNIIATLAGLPIREYVSTFNGPFWREAIIDPAPHVRWIVLLNPTDAAAEGFNDRVTKRALANPYFLAEYAPVFTSGNVAIYKRQP